MVTVTIDLIFNIMNIRTHAPHVQSVTPRVTGLCDAPLPYVPTLGSTPLASAPRSVLKIMTRQDCINSPVPTNPLTLIERLPSDAAGYRVLHSQIEQLLDEIDPYLDAFSDATSDGLRSLDHQAALADLVCRRRQLMETAILLLSIRLGQAPIRSLYAGNLLVDLCESALGGRCSQYLSILYENVARIDPAGWSRLKSSLEMLTHSGTFSWRRWPMPQLARETCEALDDIERPWALGVVELRQTLRGGANRSKRRDPAFRRAIAWHKTVRGLLARLRTQGGPARIIVDYCFMIIAQFEYKARQDWQGQPIIRASRDLLILEVFGILAQFSLADSESDPSGPHYLEQGNSSRRKRIQRSRLRVLSHWELLVDDHGWLDQLYPRLQQAAREFELASNPDGLVPAPSAASPTPPAPTAPPAPAAPTGSAAPSPVPPPAASAPAAPPDPPDIAPTPPDIAPTPPDTAPTPPDTAPTPPDTDEERLSPAPMMSSSCAPTKTSHSSDRTKEGPELLIAR